MKTDFSVETNDGLDVSNVHNLFQVHEFDPVYVRITNGQDVTFEVPLTEWLRELVRIENDGVIGEFDEKLTFSNYRLCLSKSSHAIKLNEVVSREGVVTDIVFSIDEFRTMLFHAKEFLLRTFISHGGDPAQLSDIHQFELR